MHPTRFLVVAALGMREVAVAGESAKSRARVRRVRAANVAGGRPHRHVVKLSDAEQELLTARAEAVGVSVPRLLVETTLEAGRGEVGRAHAAAALLELDTLIRRLGNNVNQLTRYAHQERELPEGVAAALVAVTRASLSVDATARWVMGLAPAVGESSIPAAPEVPESGEDEEWLADLDAGPQDFS